MDERASTIGVEEEFVLADPASGAVALAAPRVLALLRDEPGVMPEFLRFQIETATPVCHRLDEVAVQLARLRNRVAEAALRTGCVALASGVPPLGPPPGGDAVTMDARYRTLAARFPDQIATAGTCACHVHVGIPSREYGVRALAAVRPWLPTLLALTANSPFAHGADTGWASARYPRWSHWPTARAPAAWRDVGEYDADVAEAIRGGAALDARSVYFYARLSPRHPTAEVRIADVCLDAGDAVLLAGLVRGLVVAGPGEEVEDSVVDKALVAAARHGLDGPAIDVFSGAETTYECLAGRLLEHIGPALRAFGDFEDVQRRLAELWARGDGAAGQRALRASSGSDAEFVARLAMAPGK